LGGGGHVWVAPKHFRVDQDDLWVAAKHCWVERHILGWRKTSLRGAKTFLGEARNHFGEGVLNFV